MYKQALKKINKCEIEYLTSLTYKLIYGSNFNYDEVKTFCKKNSYNKWPLDVKIEKKLQKEEKDVRKA